MGYEIPGQKVDHSTVGARREVQVWTAKLKQKIDESRVKHERVVPITTKTPQELEAEVKEGWVAGIEKSQPTGDKD